MLTLVLFFVVLFLTIRFFIGRKSDSVACLVGKTAIVTGGNSGLGYATSLLLASRGCKVIIADRDDSSESLVKIISETGNTNVFYKHLDLSSFKKIREFVDCLKETEEKIDILINNAGIAASNESKTEDNLNPVMQINYFGAIFLTNLLLDFLKKSSSSRVIFLSSISIFLNDLGLDNLNPMNPKSVLKTYANSKLCCILAAQEFGKKFAEFGINTYSVDPGAVRSRIFTRAHNVTRSLFFKLSTSLILLIFGQDIMDGAQTIFHVATDRKLKNETGEHYAFLLRMFKPDKMYDKKFCEQIWKKSEDLVKLHPNDKKTTN